MPTNVFRPWSEKCIFPVILKLAELLAVLNSFVVIYICQDIIFICLILPGDIIIYAGGQQPFQRVNVGSNVLQATFTITA